MRAELGRLLRPLLLVQFRQALLIGEFIAEEIQRLVERGRDTDEGEPGAVLVLVLVLLFLGPLVLVLLVGVLDGVRILDRVRGRRAGVGGRDTEEFREGRVVEHRLLRVVPHDHIAPTGQLLPQLTRLGLRKTPQQLVKFHGRSLAGGSDSPRAAGPAAVGAVATSPTMANPTMPAATARPPPSLRRIPTAAGPSPGRAR
ncbi:hypothetical protein [Streptomyces antimycoticus]|uniref:hypothetical protein n=1 Tax=Streptomyces antimycoticus TaxID=68175 RepID=UPI002570D634|nr:hypothetical protein [Streptomyces antimycoticus]WJD95823.1 hypothetical protein QR300_07330 [Streptomyces antimycoticus]